MSLARRHFQRVTAGQESAVRPPAGATITGGDTGLLTGRMLARLHADEVNLKQIKSLQAKIEAKRQLLPEYDAYVDGVLAADAGGDDAVLVTIMVWRIDAGAWDGALAIAAYALRHRLTLPARFSRDLPTLVLEEVAEAALAQLQDGTVAEGMADTLDRALELTADADMPDEVRAKAHKAMGLLLRESMPAAALDALRRALTLDRSCGVKTEIGRLEKAVAGATDTTNTGLPPSDDGGAGT